MNERQKIVDALLRSDFLLFLHKEFESASGGDSFAPNWHREAIVWQLDRIRAGPTRG